MNETDPFRLGVEIATTLDGADVPNALGGAIALAAWGIPRATVDVDLNVFVGEEHLPTIFGLFDAMGVDVDREAALARHRRDGMFVLVSADGVRIDVFTPSIAFSWEAARTSVRVQMLGSEVSVLSAEALSVFKLLFFRTKDIADLERLLATQAGALDTHYVRRWIVDMMGEDDVRVAKWNDLVQAFG